jgi:hypothetical protein
VSSPAGKRTVISGSCSVATLMIIDENVSASNGGTPWSSS